MRNWEDNIWYFDTEVLPHHWLFCAESIQGERVYFSNDNAGLKAWIKDTQPLLCGFNSKHFDAYIVKAILLNLTPEDVKDVSDAIIVDGIQGWAIQMGWIVMPKFVDLMLDLPTRPSLKLIEGNLGMDIQESSVAFDNANPNEDEWNELLEYCWHDVEALTPLYRDRLSYLKAKETIAKMSNIMVEDALNMTNAKLTAKFLGANKVERDDERNYVYPSNIDREFIPKEVFEFFDRLPNSELTLDVLFGKEGVADDNGKVVKSRNPYKSLAIDIGGCPSVIGWGGIHGAIKKYQEETTDDRIIMNTDVTSYYPSLMIVNKLISRNVPNPDIFEEVFNRRIEAKLAGDKTVNEALKLILNTTYGASNNKYNPLYDPLMAHSVCISGQLYLIQLTEQLYKYVPTIKILQVNTDGVMFSLDKKYESFALDIIHQWEEITGFGLENTYIDKIVQRDVNNYVMKETNGKIKFKGAVVSDYEGGTFKHNSISVVCKAVVDFLLKDIPIRETIESCNDPFAFQMIKKAGGTFDRVLHDVDGVLVQVNKVNRIYASKDERLGIVYKMKGDKKNKVPSCPDHAIVDNSARTGIDKIDKEWYINITQDSVNEFLGIRRKRMATKKVETEVESKEVDVKPTPKTTKKKVDKYPTFKEKLFALSNDMATASKSFIKDGYNQNQSYEYVKASQYKTVFRNALTANRLMHKIDDLMSNMSDALKSDKMVLTQYHGVLTIIDVDSDDETKYMIWAQGADNLDKGLSKAKTLALKDFIKTNYLISDNEDDPEESVNEKGGTTPKKSNKPKFTTPADAKAKKEGILKDVVPCDTTKIERITKAVLAIREASGKPEYGIKVLEEVEQPTSDIRAEVLLTKLEMRGNEYELEV